MPEFAFAELLSLGPDTTDYRLLTTAGVSSVETVAGTFLRIEPEALTLITETAMRASPSSAPEHLQQCGILDDPESADNERSSPSTCWMPTSQRAAAAMWQTQGLPSSWPKGPVRTAPGGRRAEIARGCTTLLRPLRYARWRRGRCTKRETGTNLPAEIKMRQRRDGYKSGSREGRW